MENVAPSQIPGPPNIMASQPSQSSNSSGKGSMIAAAVCFVVAALAIFIALGSYGKASKLQSDLDDQNSNVSRLDKQLTVLGKPLAYVQEQIDSSKYQAVFLGSGQVYFGKITHID